MTQSQFLVPEEDDVESRVLPTELRTLEDDGSLASSSSGFGSLPRKDRPSVISRGLSYGSRNVGFFLSRRIDFGYKTLLND